MRNCKGILFPKIQASRYFYTEQWNTIFAQCVKSGLFDGILYEKEKLRLKFSQKLATNWPRTD